MTKQHGFMGREKTIRETLDFSIHLGLATSIIQLFSRRRFSPGISCVCSVPHEIRQEEAAECLRSGTRAVSDALAEGE